MISIRSSSIKYSFQHPQNKEPWRRNNICRDFKESIIDHRDAISSICTEQTKIAEILSTVDRRLRDRGVDCQAAAHQKRPDARPLTRGIDEHGNLRTEQTHKFKDSPLGRIPVEWEVKALDSCVRNDGPICYGILMPGTGYDNGVPVIKVKDVVGGKIHQDNLLLPTPKSIISTNVRSSAAAIF
jgi:type I restriction enzyme S subunit